MNTKENMYRLQRALLGGDISIVDALWAAYDMGALEERQIANERNWETTKIMVDGIRIHENMMLELIKMGAFSNLHPVKEDE